MPRINILLVLALVVFFAIFIGEVSGTQDSLQKPDSYNDVKLRDTLLREKRQLESFDEDEYAPSPNQNAQEEPSFWDRIVKAALKLFNRFIEWLNT